MSETEDDIRAVAESLAKDAERLRALEEKKATLELDDPELVELMEQSAELIDEIDTKGAQQQALVEDATAGA